ncbi:hypothetical protein [Mycobacterium sp. AZCC_0083]|nr:hypothetical protein [Mycobacterium sp. AZCC_0083]MBB5167523.1 putative amidohydrolase [Mycobacterium sp. AZCC_0083]
MKSVLVACGPPEPYDVEANIKQYLENMRQAAREGIKPLVFPE